MCRSEKHTSGVFWIFWVHLEWQPLVSSTSMTIRSFHCLGSSYTWTPKSPQVQSLLILWSSVCLVYLIPHIVLSRASDVPRDYDGACIQMRLSYSPVAHLFLFLVQWTDCSLAGALGLLRILIYKVLFLFSHSLVILSMIESRNDVEGISNREERNWACMLYVIRETISAKLVTLMMVFLRSWLASSRLNWVGLGQPSKIRCLF